MNYKIHEAWPNFVILCRERALGRVHCADGTQQSYHILDLLLFIRRKPLNICLQCKDVWKSLSSCCCCCCWCFFWATPSFVRITKSLKTVNILSLLEPHHLTSVPLSLQSRTTHNRTINNLFVHLRQLFYQSTFKIIVFRLHFDSIIWVSCHQSI